MTVNISFPYFSQIVKKNSFLYFIACYLCNKIVWVFFLLCQNCKGNNSFVFRKCIFLDIMEMLNHLIKSMWINTYWYAPGILAFMVRSIIQQNRCCTNWNIDITALLLEYSNVLIVFNNVELICKQSMSIWYNTHHAYERLILLI